MKTFPPNRSTTAALTLPEVAITVGVILILVFIFVTPFVGSKPKSARITCVNHLKQISLSFRIWANDSRDGFPMAYADKLGGAKDSIDQGKIARVFQIMSNELVVPKTVICPADTRVAATNWNDLGSTHISYFVGLDAEDTRPDMLLAGDRNLALNGRLLTGIALLGTNSPLTWTKEIHKEAGNIALADGSVMQVNTAQLRQQLAKTGDTTNRVMFPQ